MKKLLVSLAILGTAALAAPDRASAWVGVSVGIGVPGFGWDYGYAGGVVVAAPPVVGVCGPYACGGIVAPPVLAAPYVAAPVVYGAGWGAWGGGYPVWRGRPARYGGGPGWYGGRPRGPGGGPGWYVGRPGARGSYRSVGYRR